MSSPIALAPLSGHTAGSFENNFVIAEWQDPGGHTGPPRLIAPPHLHRNDDEAWYVLEGCLHVRAGSDTIVAQAGSCALVPRGKPHTYWNPGPAAVHYLLIMTPTIFRLISEIHQMPDRNAVALLAVFEKYDSELLDG